MWGFMVLVLIGNINALIWVVMKKEREKLMVFNGYTNNTH